MPVLTKAIGAKLRACEVDVSRRRILAFSAAIGATFDRHFDDTHPDDLVAFPTITAMFEHALLSNGFEDGFDPTNATLEELRRGVQAAQDTTFHGSIRSGQHIRASGRIVAIKPTSAGSLMRVALELVDTHAQQTIANSWVSLVFLQTETLGVAAEMAEPPALPERTDEALASASACAMPIASTFPHVYSECANIWNPIHTERRAAAAAGLPGIILHGSASWSLALVRIVASHCDGDGTRVKRATAAFRGMVFPGTRPTLRFHREGNWVSYAVSNDANEVNLRGMVEVA